MKMVIKKIEFIPEGKRELLTDDDIMGTVKDAASTLASKLGSGYETDSRLGRVRGNASVFTTDEAAIRDNLENNTAMKALGGMLQK